MERWKWVGLIAIFALFVGGSHSAGTSALATGIAPLHQIEIFVGAHCGIAVCGAWVAARVGIENQPWPCDPQKDQFVDLVKTDIYGMAILRGIPIGQNIEIAVWGKWWAISVQRFGPKFLLGKQALKCSFEMESGRDLEVRVVNLRGRPVADASITIHAGYEQLYSQIAQTDASGVVKFASVPNSRNELSWHHTDYANCGGVELCYSRNSKTIFADPGFANINVRR
jgi:hypothetical protein